MNAEFKLSKSSDSKLNYSVSITEQQSVTSIVNQESTFHNRNDKQEEFPKKLKWKIDLLIMPFFCAIYFLQFLDKTLINYAAIMGLKKHLIGNQFSNLGTIFYVSFLAVEPIDAYLIQKFPAGKFLGFNICCWGIVVAFHALTKSYASLMVIRVLLGVFEAAVAPCLIIIGSKWWTKAEQSRRTFLWYAQIGVATIVGSLMSFGFQHVVSLTLESWQIMFMFMGILTFIVGILTVIFLPDNPVNCKYFTAEEKELILEHIKENQTGLENKKYKFYQVKEMLLEIETWLMFFILVLTLTDNGAVTTFSSQIIKDIGFSNQIASLVQMPLGFVAIISAFLCCYVTSYTGERALMMSLVSLPAIMGCALFTGLPKSNKAGRLIGVYLLNFNSATIAQAYSWNAANTSGYTKKTARNAMTLMAFCIGNLIGPQLFQANSAPDYIPAKIVLIVFLSVSCILSIVLRFVVIKENKRRDLKAVGLSEEEKSRETLLLDLTDRENQNFRYSY
jgi:MFS family permease